MAKPKCQHHWGDWHYHGPKRVMQIRSCRGCPAQERRKDPTFLREKLDLYDVSVHLADGWRRYMHLFGVAPQGTAQQFRAMLELSYVEYWRAIRDEPEGGKESC